jgi:purine nucleosidase
MTARPIVLDCDPGHDDALAILLALASPAELEVLAVTAVAGNVPLALTAMNARKVCGLAGRADIPVYAGCERPLVRPLETAEYVHGRSGLDGAELPEPAAPLAPGHAADAIIDILRTRPAGTVTLCPTGPLTNVALAMVKAPDIVPRIREIVLMGGAIGLGNVTPAAEFNIFVDPHAAAVARCLGPGGAGRTLDASSEPCHILHVTMSRHKDDVGGSSSWPDGPQPPAR